MRFSSLVYILNQTNSNSQDTCKRRVTCLKRENKKSIKILSAFKKWQSCWWYCFLFQCHLAKKGGNQKAFCRKIHLGKFIETWIDTLTARCKRPLFVCTVDLYIDLVFFFGRFFWECPGNIPSPTSFKLVHFKLVNFQSDS